MKIGGAVFFAASQSIIVSGSSSAGEIQSNLVKMNVQGKFESEEAAIVRRELITSAPSDFKPANAASKIRFRLKLEKSDVRAGEAIRYQLELINEGGQTFAFSEAYPSLFKTGRPSDRMRLMLKEPAGTEINLRPPLPSRRSAGAEIKFPPGLSSDQKVAAVEEMRLRANAAGHLFAKLAPGETLRARGDGSNDYFRTLRTRYRFNVPGNYELRAVYGGLDEPGASSNSVRLTIIK